MQALKDIYHNPKYHTIIVFTLLQSIFIGMTLLVTGYLLTKSLPAYVTSFDSANHLQEAKEITNDITHLKWPGFTFFDGMPGDAITTCYPWGAFIPFILADLMKLPLVSSIRIAFFLTIYLSYDIFYLSAKSYWRNRHKALIFAVLINIAPLYIEMFSGLKDYAQAFALPFMAVAIFGWLCWVKNGRWQMLSLGIIVLMYMSFVLCYMTILALILMTLAMPKVLIKEHRFINALKAIIAAVMTTAMIWVPIVYLKLVNKIFIPIQSPIVDNQFTKAQGQSYYFTAIPDIIIIVILLCRFRALSRLTKRIFIISMFFVSCSYCVIPMRLMVHTPLMLIQFSWRYLIISHLLLVMIWVPVFKDMLAKFSLHRLFRIAICSYLVVAGLSWPFFILQNNFMNQNELPLNTSHVEAHVGKISFANFVQFRGHHPSSALKGRFYLDDYMPRDIVMANDKVPKRIPNNDFMHSYIPDLFIQQDMQDRHIKCINNGIEFYQYHSADGIRLPIVLYHGQNYKIYDNHHQIKSYSCQSHELVLAKVDKGVHRITFGAPVMWYRWSAMLISLGSVLVWIIIDLKKRKDKLCRLPI